MPRKINLILPKHKVPKAIQGEQRLYFLAGPIRGAIDWHQKAIRILSKKDPGCYIVCPSRYGTDHKLYKHSLKGVALKKNEFPNQTMWERYYLKKASMHGSILFWLPLEDTDNPRKDEDGPYAQDSFGELGRWSAIDALKYPGKASKYHTMMVIGAEKGFYGLSVIKKNLDADYGYPFPIHETLEATVEAAILNALKPRKRKNRKKINGKNSRKRCNSRKKKS